MKGWPTVDVVAVLDAMKDTATQELNWETSIVDLMKLLSMDSSLPRGRSSPRSCTMTATHPPPPRYKQILRKLAENGGKLPDDLKHAT